MKKTIALLLALAMCLSLYACGRSQNVNVPTSNITSPKDTNDQTHHNSETTISETTIPDTTDPSSAENTQPDKIVITTDNWQEYLELKQVVEWREYGCMITNALGLKDEYADRKVSAETTLNVEWTGTWVARKLTSNSETKTFEIGGIFDEKPAEKLEKQSYFHPNLLNLEHYLQQHAIVVLAGETGYSRYVRIIEDFAIVSASGIICFE